MKNLIITGLFSLALLAKWNCLAEASQLPPPELAYEAGSCHPTSEPRAITFFPATHGNEFDLRLYMLPDGVAYVHFVHFKDALDPNGNIVRSIIRKEILSTTWNQIPGQKFEVARLGVVSFIDLHGTQIFLTVDNSYFTELAKETIAGAKGATEFDYTGKSILDACR